MRTRLPSILGEDQLPLPELCAARLDGDVFAIDECFTPVDSVEGAALRAGALEHLIPAGTVVERESALWVYGVRPLPPNRHTLCVPVSSRARVRTSPRWRVRECAMRDEELRTMGGLRIVTVLRAAVDLLRSSVEFSETERADVEALRSLGDFTDDDVRAGLRAGRSVPGNRRALGRLATVQGAA